MSDFPFRATILIPVYNVEKYLDSCINSLKEQTEPFGNMEILLINDGSRDNSADICRRWADEYENIHFYSKENEGLSKTRNFGLRRAQGKYIFFLDSDDTLAPDTVKSVVDYFDTVYNEVDLVTYRITQYFKNAPPVYHFRYRTLTHTGVYDLDDPKTDSSRRRMSISASRMIKITAFSSTSRRISGTRTRNTAAISCAAR